MSVKYLPLSVLLISIPAFAGNAPGIKNFDQVDQHVYRGGQPTDEGFQQLAKLGVKIVIDLREAGERATAEARTVQSAGMTYINVPMSGLTPPSEAGCPDRVMRSPCWRRTVEAHQPFLRKGRWIGPSSPRGLLA